MLAGSTGAAALKLGCYFVGMDLDNDCMSCSDLWLGQVTGKSGDSAETAFEGKVNDIGSSLLKEASFQPPAEEEEESDDDMGFGLFD